MNRFTLLIWAIGLPATLFAQDRDLEHGFVVNAEVTVNVNLEKAYAAFMNISDWWDPAHTYSGNAQNLKIESDCFCEDWDNGRVRHLELVANTPPELIRFQGGLGPIQGLAASGTMNISFGKTESQTTLISLEYTVFGYAENGLNKWREPVDQVLTQQLERLAGQLRRPN